MTVSFSRMIMLLGNYLFISLFGLKFKKQDKFSNEYGFVHNVDTVLGSV